MIAVAVLVVLAMPALLLVGLLRLVDARQRRRDAVVARQIAVTDAIHAALGPVVAPVVRRGRGGRWTVVLAVAPDAPHVASMVGLARGVLGDDTDIVLTALPTPRTVQRRPAPASKLALSGARLTR
ncbi:MAG TPA: hypothetical protein VHZ49_04430 [Methylomirabilota bacterium]|jgi:hypothetical protein|nr:hypothetical protein [Methylomirabilota bacterium]